MNCENCENYKPKNKSELQKIAEGIDALLHEFCNTLVCEECPLGDCHATCNMTKIRQLLEEKGAVL